MPINLRQIIKQCSPWFAEVSCHVIDINTGQTFSYNQDKFLYPASVYKIFIGAEVLRQVENGTLSLNQRVAIAYPNNRDNEAHLYPVDKFPLLKHGDHTSLDILLSLMFGRSDNTASNTLIDLVGRESITQNIILPNGWDGSGVTRKFLNRIYENAPYRFADTTVSCGRHIAEFFQLVETNEMVSPFISQKLRMYMQEGHDDKHGVNASFSKPLFSKGGWLEIRGAGFFGFTKSLIRNRGVIRYHAQGAVLGNSQTKLAVGIIAKYRLTHPGVLFNMRKLGYNYNIVEALSLQITKHPLT